MQSVKTDIGEADWDWDYYWRMKSPIVRQQSATTQLPFVLHQNTLVPSLNIP